MPDGLYDKPSTGFICNPLVFLKNILKPHSLRYVLYNDSALTSQSLYTEYNQTQNNMKKLLTIALCFASVASLSAQKEAVNAAKKLSGKLDKLEEARTTIKGAMENPETANDPNTYFVAGKIEFDAFAKENTKAQTDKNYNADTNVMGDQLLNGFQYFMKAMVLDNQPDQNGKVKAKHTGNIVNTLSERSGDYWNAGANFFNDKKFDKAYKAFYFFGEIASNNPLVANDSTIALAYNNAGIAAYSVPDLQAAVDAFAKARKTNAADSQPYIYEIASWQALAQKDSTVAEQAKNAIYAIAEEGYQKFGTKPLFFLNNIVSYNVDNGNLDKAIGLVDDVMQNDPDNGNVYGLRAFVNERRNDFAAAENDYRKALELGNADFDTYKNAAIYLYKRGTELLNNIDSNNADARAKKASIKDNYFMPASKSAEAARKINPSDSNLNNIIDNIDYAITTYF